MSQFCHSWMKANFTHQWWHHLPRKFSPHHFIPSCTCSEDTAAHGEKRIFWVNTYISFFDFVCLALVIRAVRMWHFAQRYYQEFYRVLSRWDICRWWREGGCCTCVEGHEGDLSKGHHGHWTKCEGARTENARSENFSTFQKEPNPVPVDPLSVGVWKQRICGGSFEQTMPGNLLVESPRGSGGLATIIKWKGDQDSHDYWIKQILIKNTFNHLGPILWVGGQTFHTS